MELPDKVSRESIAAAKWHQQHEREQVYQQTGVRIVDAPFYIIGCPQVGCRYTASAQSEGRAVRSLSAHLVWHMRKEQK